MKKALLSLAVGLLALTANAQGITSVGANIPVVPSWKYSPDEEWTAMCYAYQTGTAYTYKGQGENTENENYNVIWGVPEADESGKMWYEVGYDTSTKGFNDWSYVDVEWAEQKAPFGTGRNYDYTAGGGMADFYFRRTFTTDLMLAGDVYLACGHDDAPAEYYLNGELIWSVTDGWNDNEVVKLTDEQKDLILLNGQENLLAVHVHQNWGGAMADVGLYTMPVGGLDMGYITPWTGKVLFNSWGGYNFDYTNNPNPIHGWEKLHEACAGDKYTIHLEGQSSEEWQEQVAFKTPITLQEGHNYAFKVTLTGTADYNNVLIKLTENENDEVEAMLETTFIEASGENNFETEFPGVYVQDLRIIFDFGDGTAGSDVSISNMSLVDQTEGKEIWIGSAYYNDFYVTAQNEEGEVRQIADPKVEGRQETLSWTMPDFDDSMWDEQAMPVGNIGYMEEIQSIWYGNKNNPTYEGDGDDGCNTNYWIRRTWTIDEINPRLAYTLNVCHDDTYWTYVNGHLLQQNSGWTGGKNPVQVHIPTAYLRVGTNVIATYIQQNWGGHFYDCGINVEEVDYNDCKRQLRTAMDLAAGYENLTLTQAMKNRIAEILANAQYQLENNKDAAELQELAKQLTAEIPGIMGSAGDVKMLQWNIDVISQDKENGYLAETLNRVKNDFDQTTNRDQINSMLNDLRLARKRNNMERRTENFKGTQPVENGMYYIYNVGEKAFLVGAEAWGAHDAVGYTTNEFQLVPTRFDGSTIDGGFKIESFRPNGGIGEADFLGWNGWLDCPTDDAWEIIPVEGQEGVYNIARLGDTHPDGAKRLLGFREGNYNACDTDRRGEDNPSNQWRFVTREERDALIEGASGENPVDLTYVITNPGFDQRLTIDAWTWSSVPAEGVGLGVWDRGGNHNDFSFEAWNTNTAELQQEIYDDIIQPGWYTLDVQGYYRDGTYDDHVAMWLAGETPRRDAYLYVYGGEEYEVSTPLCDFGDGMNKVPGLGRLDGTGQVWASDNLSNTCDFYFENGLYWNTIKFQVTEENRGYIKIGVRNDANKYGNWVTADNFRLTYYGQDEPTGGRGVNYDKIRQEIEDAIALAGTATSLNEIMSNRLNTLVAEAQAKLASTKDAFELKGYARDLKENITTILASEEGLALLKKTIDICKTEDKGYLTASLANAESKYDQVTNSTETYSLLNDLRLARRRNAMERRTETFVGSKPEAGGEYFFYNVGEKAFLTGGDQWGAYDCVGYTSNAFKLVDEDSYGNFIRGGFKIETFRPNGEIGVADFIHWSGWLDTASDEPWEFVPVDGKENVYNLAQLGREREDGSKFLLGFRDGNDGGYPLTYNVCAVDMTNPASESNQWMLISKEEMDGFMANASGEKPADATYLIVNPGFDQRLTLDAWNKKGKCKSDPNNENNPGVWGRGGNYGDFAFEAWNTTGFDLTQTIEDEVLKPGWYTFSVQGFYREGSWAIYAPRVQNGETGTYNAYMYVGDEMRAIQLVDEGINKAPGCGEADASGTLFAPNNPWQACSDYFENGLFWNTMKFQITEENQGKVTLGIKKVNDANEDWVVVDNFRLKYYGKDEPIVDGINEINPDIFNGKETIYNLMGQKLQKIQKGINIVNGRKVLVK
ncbi:MAG: hypothetical protein IJK94_05170 [Bacteroidaceae bacterium]|nr:hypothetical protein [Bacteroidaceae bacterium]